jgi:glutaminase
MLEVPGEGGVDAHGNATTKSIPHNPCINAGAIMCASLVKAEETEDARFDYVIGVWEKLAGRHTVGFQNGTYMGERATADRNFCLGYMMCEEGAFPENSDLIKTLESYFMYCSIELTAESMAVVAGSLANGGVCPTTGEKVFEPETVKNILSIMQSCGM